MTSFACMLSHHLAGSLYWHRILRTPYYTRRYGLYRLQKTVSCFYACQKWVEIGKIGVVMRIATAGGESMEREGECFSSRCDHQLRLIRKRLSHAERKIV